MGLDWPHTRVELISGGAAAMNQQAVASGEWRGWFRNHVLWQVREGSALLRTRTGPMALEPGAVVWFQPGFEYRFDRPIAGRVELYTAHVHLIDTTTGEPHERVPNVAEVMRPEDPHYVAGVLRRVDALAERTRGQHHRVFRGHRRTRAERLMTELLTELTENHPADASAIDEPADPVDLLMLEMGERIALHPEHDHPVEALAEEAALSVAQFAKRFQRVNREKPHYFILRHRIALASQLLTETGLPISEVARRSGYSSIYYFSRHFKQWTGRTPTQFRRGAQPA